MRRSETQINYWTKKNFWSKIFLDKKINLYKNCWLIFFDQIQFVSYFFLSNKICWLLFLPSSAKDPAKLGWAWHSSTLLCYQKNLCKIFLGVNEILGPKNVKIKKIFNWKISWFQKFVGSRWFLCQIYFGFRKCLGWNIKFYVKKIWVENLVEKNVGSKKFG